MSLGLWDPSSGVGKGDGEGVGPPRNRYTACASWARGMPLLGFNPFVLLSCVAGCRNVRHGVDPPRTPRWGWGCAPASKQASNNSSNMARAADASRASLSGPSPSCSSRPAAGGGRPLPLLRFLHQCRTAQRKESTWHSQQPLMNEQQRGLLNGIGIGRYWWVLVLVGIG